MPELLLPPSRQVSRYGFRPSLPRHDEPVANVGTLKVLTEVDPRPVLSHIVENQAALGSCTANATSNAFRYDSIVDGHDCGQLCRFQIYWGERKLEGMLGQGDTGAEGHDAFTVAQAGIAAESAWPYTWPGINEGQSPDNSIFDPAALPDSVLKAPAAYKLTKQVATVPQNLTHIKAVLSNQQTIAIGFTVYESFESEQTARTGVMPVPGPGEQVMGGHEVLVCGYLKSEPHYALVLNSWGNAWGLKGFFLMPWAVVTNARMTSDLRTIVRPAHH